MYLKLSNKGTMHSKLFLFQLQKKKKNPMKSMCSCVYQLLMEFGGSRENHSVRFLGR